MISLCVFNPRLHSGKKPEVHNTNNNNPIQSKQALGQLRKNGITSFVSYGMGMRLISLKHVIYPTLLAFSISNIRGKPCVMSSSVYSSSWMDLNSFSKHWMRGRLCCWKDVRKDSSHVCSVQGTPTDRGQSSYSQLQRRMCPSAFLPVHKLRY